jgi:hypothetical protein
MKPSIARLVGSLFAVLAFSVLLGNSALAGGGPGPGPEYVKFTPQAYDLTPQGELVLTGTLVCNIGPGEVVIGASAWEVAGNITSDDPFFFEYQGKLVEGGNSVYLTCDANTTQPVTLVVAADAPRGFRPGHIDIALEEDYHIYDASAGYYHSGNYWGIIGVDLRP